jgi:sugar lactone lactonase YvrE
MSIAAGTRLGPYEVLSLLGAGGMGEVYRARDTRLGREVAVKVLPPGFSEDPDRRARFEREAQAVAALSHPNVVAIHDTGVHDEQTFVVMELLSGQTLRERLTSGAVPVRKAVDIAVQIARGLGAAHGKGLVHRDLKPENVFLLDDGQVKILDFGLARQTAREPGHSGATQTVAATDPGTVMGTIGYMAPEQVRGQAVDARADVFALGAVLYELVTGVRAFQRETAADTMTAILTQDPPEAVGSRPDLSPALDRIVRHCLEKNPDERFQSARDVAFALEALSGSTRSDVAAAVVTGAPRARRALSPLVAGALVLAAGVAGIFGGRALGTAPAPASLKFTMKTFEPQAIFNARFMPDGETIVFSSAPSGNTARLFEIRQGTLEARPFGPPKTHLLSISSKGELAVLTDAAHLGHRLFTGTLARMTLEGAPRPWLNQVREADWSPDGSTIAVIRDLGAKDQLEYPAGTTLYEANGYLSDPRVSPDGSRVAFMEHPARFDDRGYVKVVDRSGTVTTLAGEFWGEEGIAWTPDGSAVLFGASAPAEEGRQAGEMSYQIYRVAADGRSPAAFALTSPGEFAIHDLAPNGRWLATRDDIRYGIVARGAGQAAERDLSWLNKSWSPFLSSDGQRVLFSDGNGGPDYAVVWRKVDGSPVVRLGVGDAGGFSPDGRLALAQVVSTSTLFVYPLGAGDPLRIDTTPVDHVEWYTWLPDSKSIAYLGSEGTKAPRVYRQPIAGGPPTPILPAEVVNAAFSPDGASAVGVTAPGAAAVYPLDGGQPKPLPALDARDILVGFTTDGRSVIVQHGGDIPARLDRIDLGSGTRSLFREFAPADPTGFVRITLVSRAPIKADGSEYAYSYLKRLSTLFVATESAGR